MVALPALTTPVLRSPPAGVWPADRLAQAHTPCVATGHAPLDAVLPGGGWPSATLIECLLLPRQWPEWRLLLPALRTAAQCGRIVLVAPPALPNLHALAAQGLPPEVLCRIVAHSAADRCWTAEQALRCPQVSAVLLWLPAGPAAPLRRLHLAAQARGTNAPALLWTCRPVACRAAASPAPLRLALNSLGTQGLSIEVLKRRGPPLPAPVRLDAPVPRQSLLEMAQARPAIPPRTAQILTFPTPHASPVDCPDLAA